MNKKLPIKCALPKGFLNAEERSGFLVSEKLKKIWAIEIDLYLQFARICEKYSIKYQIFGGSLLGAIRHGGYIPWDDDFDVAMTREEFRKFIEVAPVELGHPYFLQTALSDRKYFCSYARLRNSETTGVIEWYSSSEYNNGIYIDIYVLDGRAKTAFANFIQNKMRWVVEKMIMARACPEKVNRIQRWFYMSAKPFVSFFSYSMLVSWYDSIMSMYNKKPEYWNQNTHGDYKYKYGISNAHWCDMCRVPFEWFDVPAPKNYDEVLTAIYGDYMMMPPISERGKWHESIVHFDPEISYLEFFKRKRVGK